MKWEGNRESDNVEDRRDGGGSAGSGGGMLGGRNIGIGTIVIALLGCLTRIAYEARLITSFTSPYYICYIVA